MFEKKKPLVEEPIVTAQPQTPRPLAETMAVADPKPQAVLPIHKEPVITLPDLMMELSIIGEILNKRHKFSKVALELQPSGFHLTTFYKGEDGEEHRYISRKIHDTLTPKGLEMVLGELRSGVGI